MSTHSPIALLEDRFAAVTRRNSRRLLPARWKIPIYAFVLAFAIVLVMIIDPYSGEFADANTAPNHWAETTGQSISIEGGSSGTITRDAFGARSAPRPATAVAGIPSPGSAQAIALGILTAEGMGNDQYSCLVSLWNRESHWRVDAENPDGAYGIPQALPGSKMSSAGPDWQTNATTQIMWGLGYIKARYGTPCGAWAHSQATGWY
ncbi:MAG TPA: lytic transglycosylase domain-containing protein [Galbitalea sp.]|nr:lytic transglycosylase domain-containing protein [Galbitalea sp.]HEX4399880.1 lytic transglycosylase domain-containing protein [Galbitalea sp.]